MGKLIHKCFKSQCDGHKEPVLIAPVFKLWFHALCNIIFLLLKHQRKWCWRHERFPL